MKNQKYSTETLLKLMKVLTEIDPCRIANDDDRYEYYAIADYTLDKMSEDNMGLIEAINEAIIILVDEDYILTEQEEKEIRENISRIYDRSIFS